MALEGSLRDFGLADILQLIFFQRKSGILSLEGRMDKVRLQFIDGNIASAESQRRKEANRIGKVLVKKGLLRDEDLQSALEEQRASNAKLGDILLKTGMVEKKDIAEILSAQIKETVIQIFSWKDGTYEFSPQPAPRGSDISVSLDTQHLLMEGLRIVDEWSQIEGKITLDTVFVRKTTSETGELIDLENDILSTIDGENDVSTIIDIVGQDDFTVSKTLVALLEKGLIETREIPPVVVETLPVETRRKTFPYTALVSLAIVAAMIMSLIPLFFSEREEINRFRASQMIDDLRYKIDAYRLGHGIYPETLSGLSSQRDPWGNAFVYEHNESGFLIISAGEDGRKGTGDDIF